MSIAKYLNIKNYIGYISIENRISRALYRFSVSKSYKKKKAIARFLHKHLVYLSPDTKLNGKVVLPHPHNIQIGLGVVIGKNCTIYQNVTIGQKNNRYPIIGDNVTIYPHACIFGDIKIGDNVVVGAGAIVNKTVPAGAVVAGNPAQIIKMKDSSNE